MQNSIGIFISPSLDVLTLVPDILSHPFHFLGVIGAEPIDFAARLLSELFSFREGDVSQLSGFLFGSVDNSQFIGNLIGALIGFG